MTAGPRSTAEPARTYGWRLGSVGGVPVYLGRSWPLIAAVIVISYGPLVGRVYDDVVVGLAFGLAFAVLLLLSVLAHEAAHAVVARRFGHHVDRVVADLFGGHTVYDSTSARPGTSAAIAVVGPVANLAVAGVAYVANGFVSDGVVAVLLDTVMRTNLFVGLFNLIPGLPLDGGFLVDSVVWKLTGNRNRGLIVAGWLGRLVTVGVVVLFVVRPLLLGQQPSWFVIGWCGLIGAFLWVGATNAIRTGNARQAIARVPLAQVLRPAVLAAGSDTLASVLSRAGALEGRADAPVAVVMGASGDPVGLVDVEAARTIDPTRWGQVPVEALVRRQPDGWVVVVPDGVPSRDGPLRVVAVFA